MNRFKIWEKPANTLRRKKIFKEGRKERGMALWRGRLRRPKKGKRKR